MTYIIHVHCSTFDSEGVTEPEVHLLLGYLLHIMNPIRILLRFIIEKS